MDYIFKKILCTLLILFSLFTNANSQEKKIKIGILVPLTGENKEIGQLIIKAIKMAVKDINTDKLEIFPKDSGSNPNQSLKSANEFDKMGINIVVGPVFSKNLIYLD